MVDFNEPGLLKIIADADDRYLVNRTIELLHEIKTFEGVVPPDSILPDLKRNHDKLKMAISLLALLRARNEGIPA